MTNPPKARTVNSDDNDEKVDGPKIAAQLLMRLNPAVQSRVVAQLNQSAPELLKRVQEKMISLDDLAKLSAKSIQVLLREIDQRDLTLALSTAKDHVRAAVLSGIPARRRAEVEEEVTQLNETSPVEIQSAEKRIVVKLDQLKEQGKVFERDDDGTWA
jgi:flagellar motor switch protein FliG